MRPGGKAHKRKLAHIHAEQFCILGDEFDRAGKVVCRHGHSAAAVAENKSGDSEPVEPPRYRKALGQQAHIAVRAACADEHGAHRALDGERHKARRRDILPYIIENPAIRALFTQKIYALAHGVRVPHAAHTGRKLLDGESRRSVENIFAPLEFRQRSERAERVRRGHGAEDGYRLSHGAIPQAECRARRKTSGRCPSKGR